MTIIIYKLYGFATTNCIFYNNSLRHALSSEVYTCQVSVKSIKQIGQNREHRCSCP